MSVYMLVQQEWGYEISEWQHNNRSNFFHDLGENVRPLATKLGYDFDELVAAKDRLRARLETLTPADIAAQQDGGLLGGFDLLGADPSLAQWLRFRKDSLTHFFSSVSAGVKNNIKREVLMGVGPRSAWVSLTLSLTLTFTLSRSLSLSRALSLSQSQVLRPAVWV
jgi:hypothetical protein